MDTDPFLTAKAPHQCRKVDWKMMTVNKEVVFYGFPTTAFYWLNE